MKKFLTAFKHHRTIKLIAKSGLFDEQYYLKQNSEMFNCQMSPLEHYVKVGSKAGLKPNAYFDDKYYRQSNPDIKSDSTNPLAHFIKFGAKEGRNPSPKFNTLYYLQQHPDVAATGANPLWHFLRHGAAELRETNNARQQALCAENQALYDELAHIEPLLPPFDALQYVPMESYPKESLAGRTYFKIARLVKKPFTHLLVLRRLIHGGADRLAMNYASVIANKLGPDSILVLLADLPTNSAKQLLPDGVSMISLDEVQPGLSIEDKIQVLSRLIIEAKPQVVHNVNSEICWQAFARYYRQFKKHSALIASLFTFHYDEAGKKVGLVPQYLNQTIDCLDVLITDNHVFKSEVSSFYALEKHNQDKIIIAYSPVMDEIRQPSPKANNSKRILWASRLHTDKRPDILAAIARALPEITFEVYGESHLTESDETALKILPNIILHGRYLDARDLPYADISCYLYTTKHDGLPIAIKEAMAAGLPVIAPAIGGTQELLSNETGWLIQEADNVPAYIKAIRECLSQPEERLKRINNAQKKLQQEHSWESFATTMIGIPAYRLSKS